MADKKEKNQGFDLVGFTDGAAKAVEKYWKAFAGIVVVGLIVVGIFQFTKSQSRNSEQDGFQQLFKITKIYNDKKSAFDDCLLYTSPSPRDATLSRMPSSA